MLRAGAVRSRDVSAVHRAVRRAAGVVLPRIVARHRDHAHHLASPRDRHAAPVRGRRLRRRPLSVGGTPMSRFLARPLDTRTIALSVAGVLALGTGVLTFNYLASVGHANAPVAQRTVLIAAKAIPAHATVTADMVNTMQRPSSAIDPDAYVAPASAV